ncbi:MAG: hypothetical protein GC136_06250 [Alphaproteobacteria bacterium]|nr:hypothetical protein [Alphaproteobacteria bacterium]
MAEIQGKLTYLPIRQELGFSRSWDINDWAIEDSAGQKHRLEKGDLVRVFNDPAHETLLWEDTLDCFNYEQSARFLGHVETGSYGANPSPKYAHAFFSTRLGEGPILFDGVPDNVDGLNWGLWVLNQLPVTVKRSGSGQFLDFK